MDQIFQSLWKKNYSLVTVLNGFNAGPVSDTSLHWFPFHYYSALETYRHSCCLIVWIANILPCGLENCELSHVHQLLPYISFCPLHVGQSFSPTLWCGTRSQYSLGCGITLMVLHNKIPQIGWFDQQNLLLMAVEPGKSQIKVWLGWVPVRPLFLAYRQLLSHCVVTWWRELWFSSSSYKDTNSIRSGLHPYDL